MMEATNSLPIQILKLLEGLPYPQQQAVYDFAFRLRVQNWESISDERAAALKAEFTQEDLELAEALLDEYVANLQQEDEA